MKFFTIFRKDGIFLEMSESRGHEVRRVLKIIQLKSTTTFRIWNARKELFSVIFKLFKQLPQRDQKRGAMPRRTRSRRPPVSDDFADRVSNTTLKNPKESLRAVNAELSNSVLSRNSGLRKKIEIASVRDILLQHVSPQECPPRVLHAQIDLAEMRRDSEYL